MSIYLKSLEISGFKSFGTNTYIEFSEGITGIVGPNGCGKSNVIESMKWVLGEQSAKSLRGEKMQDIIFAGTKHRSASGMAHVSLTFNNELNWLPLEFPEISIGRRIFRSGEGQYFINNARTRLKDITELFLDTGVGRGSYAIFEQGKIDRLLSESAEDRRILFEDFAGISKFKFRKEEAEKKLAFARENLERIQEILLRLEQEITNLEVQAKEAENYNIINNELRELEIKFEVARIYNMNKEIARREADISKLKETLSPMSDQLNKIENDMLLSDKQLGEKEYHFGQLNTKYIALEKELSESKIHYHSALKNKEEHRNRLRELEIRSKQDFERLEEWEDLILEKHDALSDAEKNHNHSQKILEQTEAKQEFLNSQITLLEQELLRQSLELGFNKALTRDDIDYLRKHITELQGQHFIQEAEIIRLEEEITTKKSSSLSENQELSHLKEALDLAQREKTHISEQKEKLYTHIQMIENHIAQCEKEQNSLLEASRICDKKILQAMDQQIEDLKIFNQGQPQRQENLKQILDTVYNHILSKHMLDIVLFEKLKTILQEQEHAYQFLLAKIFGEDGVFTEKIAIADQIDHCSSQIVIHRENLEHHRQQFSQINEEENSAFQKLTKIDTLYKTSEKELFKTEKFIVHAQEKISQTKILFQDTKNLILQKNSQLEHVEQAVNSYDTNHYELRLQNSNLQEELKDAHIDFHSTDTQSKALKHDIKSLEERVLDGQKQIKNFESDKAQINKMLIELEQEIDDFLIEQDELIPELTQLQESMKQTTDEINALQHAKKSLEQLHKDRIEQFTKLRIRKSEIEGALSERRFTLENMKTSLMEQFATPFDQIVLEHDESVENLNSKIRDYRNQLNQLGNVNLLAIEQFQNTKEKYSQLLFQKEDIEKATHDTEFLINETNRESSEKFTTAFNKIRHSFKTLFSELFDGGRADLILRDKEHPLTSGIDIMAEPPGQKFQNVSLLSGGQRAMVAIAVIFSILELKPTPFVILDEMDAPLDDENIDRFKRLLTRFKGLSQFVVVSHSKSTLEVCDVLFGVTMEELGCSKVVSVAFDETENLLFA